MSDPDLFPEVATKLDGALANDRYTTRATMAWAARTAGVAMWDLDVAACEESHKADVFFTKESNGLEQPWFGRVWCNPPYDDIAPWVTKAWAEMVRDGGPSVIAMLIPASRTEQPWWQQDVEKFRDDRHWAYAPMPSLTTYFLPGRPKFGHPGNPEGVGVGSPPFGCVLLVWRRA